MTFPPAGPRIIRDDEVRMANLIHPGERAYLEEVIFEDCHIVGPAVLFLSGSQIRSCRFSMPPEVTVLRLDPDQEVVTGLIRLDNCLFERCRFDPNIGLVGPGLLEMLTEDLGSE